MCDRFSGQVKRKLKHTLSEEVDVDSWWNFLEGKILEGIAFKDIKEERVIASFVAPWIPPACSGRVVNTEHLKSNARNHHSPPIPAGCPKILAICGIYDPLNLGGMSIAVERNL